MYMYEWPSAAERNGPGFLIPDACFVSSLIISYQEMENKQKAISASYARLKELRAWSVSTCCYRVTSPADL